MRWQAVAFSMALLAGCNGDAPRAGLASVMLPVPAGGAETADAALARDPETGDVLLSWVGGDSAGWALYFARSGDEGQTWESATAVTAPGLDLRPTGESSPRLVPAAGGRVALVWTRSVPVPGQRWPATEIRIARSLDGGATWSPPLTLNDDSAGTPAGHQFQGAAWQGDSGLVVSWLDERKGAAERVLGGTSPTAGDPTDEPDAVIVTAFSPDFGRTWGQSNELLWGQVCPCCRVTLARHPDGSVISAWRKHYPGNIRDVVTAPVAPGLRSEPVRVNQDNWVYPGCPYTGPGIAVGHDGARHVVWYMGKEGAAGVYYQRVDQGGSPADPPLALIRAQTLPSAHTTVAALPGGRALAAYDQTGTGDRAVGLSLIGASRDVLEQHTIAGSEGGQYPQVLSVGPGRALVAWVGRSGERRAVRLAAITFNASEGSAVALRD